MKSLDATLFERIGSELGAFASAEGTVDFTGPIALLPSVYEVGALASAAVGAAAASVAALHAVRTGKPQPRAKVDRAHAAVAFRSERYLSAPGWSSGGIWDPLAGDYRTADGWVRLHTNYPYHRDAALRVLGVPATREAIERAVLASSAEAIEAAVVAEGGCAARSRTAEEWAEHPQGAAIAREPLFAVATWPAPSADLGPPGARGPLGGVRVLDLTRVLAGPLCTRVLASFGADVMRVDPKGFEEVSALVPETSAGKRRTRLNLRSEPCRAAFEQLVAGAHVLVHGYRSDALDRLGFGAAWRRAVNPALLEVSLDAYGFSGPWAARRGFDSLVQMSAGIADRGRAAMGTDRPHPLPAQALDHATGYLMAAAVCRALVRAITDGTASATRLSLARVAKLLTDLGDRGDPKAPEVTREEVARWTESAPSAFGTIWRVRSPVVVDGLEPHLHIAPGLLGVDRPVW